MIPCPVGQGDDVSKQREIWFRNMIRWAPWSVHPIHWKGFALIILGPIILIGVWNVLFMWRIIPLEISGLLFIVGIIAFVVAVYRHTSWD